MSFNGSGTFVLNIGGYPYVTGTVISSVNVNLLLADIASGLSLTVTRDGQTSLTGPLHMGSNYIDGVTNLTATGTISTSGQFTGPGTGLTGTATSLTAGTSTTASNLAVGSAGTLPYQTAAATTAMLAAGTSGNILKANGAAAPSWVAQSTIAAGTAATASNLTGTPTLPNGTAATTQAYTDISTNLATTGFVHQQAAWTYFIAAIVGSAGAVARSINMGGGIGISSVGHPSTGNYTVNFSSAFPGNGYFIQITCEGSTIYASNISRGTTSFTFTAANTSNDLAADTNFHVYVMY